jgi:hypothetical protein
MADRTRSRFTTLYAALAAGLLAGCGGSDEDKWTAERPKPVPAGGIVLYNGDPVEGATVVFVPEGHKQAATAQTDASGKFQLQTYDPGDGAVPGEYKVTVRKAEATAAPASEETNVNDTTAPKQRSLIPERYSNVQQTDLTASVKEGAENNFTLELTD